MMRSKSGQFISLGLLFVLFALTLVVSLFFEHTDASLVGYSNHGLLQTETNAFATTLLSKGTPVNWNIGDVQRIGLMDNDTLLEAKIRLLDLMVSEDYESTKKQLGINKEYRIEIQKKDETMITGIFTEYELGKSLEELQELEQIATISRFVLLQKTDGSIYPVTLKVYLAS